MEKREVVSACRQRLGIAEGGIFGVPSADTEAD